MTTTTPFTLPARPPFDFRSTVESHGWPQLAPFRWDAERAVLSRVEEVSSGVVAISLRGTAAGEEPARAWLDVEHAGPLPAADAATLQARAGRILDLDRDLSEFHRLAEGKPGFENVAQRCMGRTLCSSTLFEDLVKTIMTTNVSWPGTKRMVSRLVEALGTPLSWDTAWRTFPTPQQVAGAGRIRLGELGMGYRAPYVAELAERMAEGRLDTAGWEDGTLDTEKVYKGLRGIKGIGDYAASSMLMLLGRADRIPVDTWARMLIGGQLFAGQTVTDQQIAGAFSEFGRWRGLAYHCYDWKYDEAEG